MSKSDQLRLLREAKAKERNRAIEHTIDPPRIADDSRKLDLPQVTNFELAPIRSVSVTVSGKKTRAKMRGKTVVISESSTAGEGLKQAAEHAKGERELRTTVVRVPGRSHPDCEVCNERREYMREKMRDRRAK